MDMQRTLFDDEFNADMAAKALHRRTDPATSQQAAEEIQKDLGRLHLKFLSQLRLRGTATAMEAAMGNESVRKRASELLKRGLIEIIGTRYCTVTGKNAQVYRYCHVATKRVE